MLPKPRPPKQPEPVWNALPPARVRPEPPRPERPEPKPVRVDFTEHEQTFVRFDGEGRSRRARARGGVHKWNDPTPAARVEQRDIDAAGGEAAVAKALNVWWHPTPYEPGAADLLGFIEVRWSERHAGARLRVHPEDDETRIYVCVTGNAAMGGIFIRGWLYGWEAKRDEWWWGNQRDNRPPAWYVPVEFLRDLDTLPDVHRFGLSVRYHDDEPDMPAA